MDGWRASEGSRETAGPQRMPEHPPPPGPAETGDQNSRLLVKPLGCQCLRSFTALSSSLNSDFLERKLTHKGGGHNKHKMITFP